MSRQRDALVDLEVHDQGAVVADRGGRHLGAAGLEDAVPWD